MSQTYEERARAEKAGALAHILIQHGATSAEVEALAPDGREMVERLAGTKPASDKTWDAVLGILRGRERAQQRPGGDAFAGMGPGL